MSAEDQQNNDPNQQAPDALSGGVDWERRERESMDDSDLDSIDVPPPPPSTSAQASAPVNNFPNFRMPREEGDERPSFYINDVGAPKSGDAEISQTGSSEGDIDSESTASTLVWPPQRSDQDGESDGGIDLGGSTERSDEGNNASPVASEAMIEASAVSTETTPNPAAAPETAAAEPAETDLQSADTVEAASESAPERASVEGLDLGFISDYRSGEPVKASDDIEERRLATILPFIAMLGYNPFDRRQVKAQAGGYRLLGEEGSLAVRIDPDGEEAFEGAVLSTSGPEWKIEVATEKGPATLAVFNLNGQQGLPSMFGWAARDTLNVEALLKLGANGAIEDVVREAILAELRNPSKAFRQAIADRLFERGFDDHAAESLPAIGAEVAELIEQSLDDKAEDGAPADEERRSMSPAEAEAFAQIKALLSRHVEEDRIFARPNSRYTAVLIDDNNRKTVARLHFDRPVKQLGTFVDRAETRHVIETPADVVAHAGRMTERLEQILKAPAKSQG